MSKLLDHLSKGYNDLSFQAIKEWTGKHGEMGVYESQQGNYIYVAVLTNDGKFWHQQHTHRVIAIAIEDAETIAAFAGAILNKL